MVLQAMCLVRAVFAACGLRDVSAGESGRTAGGWCVSVKTIACGCLDVGDCSSHGGSGSIRVGGLVVFLCSSLVLLATLLHAGRVPGVSQPSPLLPPALDLADIHPRRDWLLAGTESSALLALDLLSDLLLVGSLLRLLCQTSRPLKLGRG